MKRYTHTLLLFCILTVTVQAQEVTLSQLMETVRTAHPQHRAYAAQQRALKAKVEAEYARDPSSLDLGIAHAKEDAGDSAKEYSLSLGIPVDISGTRGLMLRSGELETAAILLRKRAELIAFDNRIRNLYHQSCLDRQLAYLYRERLSDLEKLYRKKRTAYRYHDISKKELLQLELERNLLRQRAEAVAEVAERSKKALLTLSDSAADEETTLSCRDMLPVRERVDLLQPLFALTRSAYENEIEAARKRYTRYSRLFEPVTVSVGYDDEIDTRRYGAGISVPLGFSSAKKERSRAYSLSQQQLLKSRFRSVMLQKEAQKEQLVSRLKSASLQIEAYDQNYRAYRKSLMPLIEKSYTMGESSLLEYLLGREKLFAIATKRIESRKNYYDTLFTLYTLTETEKNEQ